MDNGTALRRLVPHLLRDQVYRRYWGASTVSMFGDQVSSIAIPLTAVIVLHARAAQMGYLTALQWLPSLLFGMYAGAWADRSGQRRRTMILADFGRAVLLAAIPVSYATHMLALWQMYAVTFAAGTLSILFNVSDGTLFVSIVEPADYVDGQSLIYSSRALSFVGGPSIGGLIVQALTAPFAILADAASFLGSAFLLGKIRPAEPPADKSAGSIAVGLSFIARSDVVRASLTGVAVINFFNMMFGALFMLYAVRVLHLRPGVLGVVLGVGALGGLLGSLLTKTFCARMGVGWSYVAGCFTFTAPLALVPLASLARGTPVLGLLFAAEFASGFGVMVLDISVGSMFAVVIPDTVRSRVTGAFQAINYGTRPGGALLGGLLGTMFGLEQALWIAVAGGVCGALLLLPSPLPRLRLPAALPPGRAESPASLRVLPRIVCKDTFATMDKEEAPERTVATLRDPKALRAYAHPVRMTLIGLLRTRGPLTATQAAKLTGESSGTTSFHLRQLAKYGLVEETGGGSGREKPWRATAMFTSIEEDPADPAAAAAGGLVRSVLTDMYFERLSRWLQTRDRAEPRWREAALFGDRFLYVTADELAGLSAGISELLDSYAERVTRPETRPEGARLVSALVFAFPEEAT
jgi:MFS family permease